ncbi:SDR family NAD(P)-dependent oxidoreductase [Xanthocytophaga agilis]|uniref:SDR family oxidoreductase n=1 Tax=Xanthocytophaga agilis TaxID=3048010 RepID=A0AAE3RCM6_9BACT|nr:SDR family oxidoreductase [Xanthocytophaga agilis]MDJ1505819.1 SDR family oxidoreductase [Xanthocytophaga agilis]
MSPLTNKVALVTGGSRGIGAAIVKRLAADGASVVFTYLNAEEKAVALVTEIEKKGGHALAIKADSGNPKSLELAVEETIKAYGQLDILVNSAGISVYSPVDTTETDPAELEKILAVNLSGVAAATRIASRYIGEGGRIISIGSTFASRLGGFSGFADYAATKAAVAAYTRGWAWDLGKKGITVNTVEPGPTATDMNPDNTDFAQSVKSGLALGRYGTVEEIAAAVAFLASPEASFITGSTLTVDGGQNA